MVQSSISSTTGRWESREGGKRGQKARRVYFVAEH